MGKNQKSVNKVVEKSVPQTFNENLKKADFSSESVKNVDRNKMALVMMIKNEEKRLEVSFDSVRPLSNTFIILDTGSTDRTIEICREYCKKHNITLFLKEEPFVNFMVSRNVLLDYCDEVLDKHNKKYLLLLDCNDELKSHKELAEFINTNTNPATGFYLKQNWWTGNNLDSYFNIRMVKSHENWRFKGVVHEYITNGKSDVMRLENIILFQDRTKDDDKSFKRFNRDKELLYNEYLKDNTDPRTLFYLGQTCGCLGNLQEAYKYYVLRSKYGGFIEEVYQSYFRLGETARQLGHPWEESLSWYMKAYSHSNRAEPLVKIAEYYMNEKNASGKNDMMTAYMFIAMACKLAYPFNQILFVDRRCYIYKRWHLMGQIAYYVQRYKEGKEACIRACMVENQEIDYKNLIWYLKKDAEIIESKGAVRFTELTVMSTDQGEIIPMEEHKQVEFKATKEEVLKKAFGIMFNK